MNVAGIDYSMNGPAITLNEKNDIYCFYWTGIKKYQSKFQCEEDEKFKSVEGYALPKYESDEERFALLADEIVQKLLDYNIEKVVLESFSYGSKGKVFEIGELFGVLKYKIWECGINIKCIPPTIIKKFATGKGNANKELIEEAFIRDYKTDVRKIINQPRGENPISDIIDSFYIWDITRK